MTADNDPGRLARVALGEAGFERATVWSAVGFAVSYVAFDVAALVGEVAGLTPAASGVAAALAALTAVGTVAFAAVGGGCDPRGPPGLWSLRSGSPADGRSGTVRDRVR